MTQLADEMRDRRRAFATPGGAHDKLIHRLNMILPAAVGVVAALMILTPLSPRGEVSFLLDRRKVAVSQDRLRVDNAMYRGQDDKGRPFSLVAGEAVQMSATVPVVQLKDLSARMLLDEGPAVLTNIATDAHDALRIGQRVRVQFTQTEGGPPVPMFAPE